MRDLSKREFLDKRFIDLRQIRQSWDGPVRDICEHVAPYRHAIDQLDPNQGTLRDRKIFNSRPVRALRTLSAGMMAGITSPARKWFKIATSDPDLMEFKPVKEYLAIAESRIFGALAQSNFYKELTNATYLDLGSAGTASMFQEENRKGGFRFRSQPWGEYLLDINEDGKVDTCFREFKLTVSQIIAEFGYGAVSALIKNQYDRGNYTNTYMIRHAIYPNSDYQQGLFEGGSEGDEFDPDAPVHASMPFKSNFWEISKDRSEKFLRVEGYHDYPLLNPRWSSTASDAYGRGPGWDARPDNKMLQHHERRFMQMIDQMVDPALKVSGNIRKASLIPGSLVNMGMEDLRNSIVEPINKIAPGALREMRERIAEVEDRIAKSYYEHLWQMLITDDRNERATATEIEAKKQEVALQLGPLLESLNDELLEPVVERTFNSLERTDSLPLPPEELDGQDLTMEFVSIMHQAQQATGLSSIQTLINEVQVISQMFPNVIHKIDADEIVDDLQLITGVRPDIIRDKKEVVKMREDLQEQEQAQVNGEAMVQATQGIKNLKGADPQNLQDLASTISPVAAGQGGL